MNTIENIVMNDEYLRRKYGLRVYRAYHMEEVFTFTDIIDLLLIKVKVNSSYKDNEFKFTVSLKFNNEVK